MAENNNEIEINSNNDVSSKRKRPIDVVDIDMTTSNTTTTNTTTANNNNNNNNSSKSSMNMMNDNKKLKTELQTVVSIAGEILLSLLPENKIKEFPEPSMRRLNLAQQIFERNNKIIDEIEKNENKISAELLYELNGNIHEIVQIYSGLEKA